MWLEGCTLSQLSLRGGRGKLMEAGSLGTACGRDSTNHICVVQWELQTLKPRFLTGEHTDGPGPGEGQDASGALGEGCI